MSSTGFSVNVLYVLSLGLLLSESTNVKEYRSDYAYNERTDAFYKFHIENETNKKAGEVCQAEGATLLMMISEEDLKVVHAMFKKYPDISDTAWISTDNKPHDSSEDIPNINLDARESWVQPIIMSYGTQKCTVVTRQGEVESDFCMRFLPFVCKVDAKEVVYDDKCLLYAKGYQFYSSVQSCYKIPQLACSWNEAYSYCAAEGAHLAVLNSDMEQRLLMNLTNAVRPVNSPAPWFFYVGVRAQKPTDGSSAVFKTVFNKTLDESGFNKWRPNEPNNHDGKEFCGTIFKGDGKYNDVDCEVSFGFICEKKIGPN